MKIKLFEKTVTLKNFNERQKMNLVRLVDSLKSNPDIAFTYRGENSGELKDTYGSANMKELTDNLFLIGEKGKNLYNDSFNNDRLPSFENTNYEGFKNVCDYLKESLYGDGGIEEFKSKNHSLIELVSDEKKTNEYFEEHYSKLCDDEKKEVNALLLTIAHTIGAECNKKHSLFLSTTTDFEVAEKFAKDIIFYCWLPNRESPVLNTYIVVKDISEKLKKYGVVVEGQCYPNECEISLLYGMIPHFMIGILDSKKDEFWPNPAIRGIKEIGGVLVNGKEEPVWSHGLYINQSDFIDRIKKTKINKFAHLVCGNKYPNLINIERTESEKVPETKS